MWNTPVQTAHSRSVLIAVTRLIPVTRAARGARAVVANECADAGIASGVRSRPTGATMATEGEAAHASGASAGAGGGAAAASGAADGVPADDTGGTSVRLPAVRDERDPSVEAAEILVGALDTNLKGILHEFDSAITGASEWRDKQNSELRSRMARAEAEAMASPERAGTSGKERESKSSRRQAEMDTFSAQDEGDADSGDDELERLRARRREMEARLAAARAELDDDDADGAGGPSGMRATDSGNALNSELQRLKADAHAPMSRDALTSLTRDGDESSARDLARAQADLLRTQVDAEVAAKAAAADDDADGGGVGDAELDKELEGECGLVVRNGWLCGSVRVCAVCYANVWCVVHPSRRAPPYNSRGQDEQRTGGL